MSKEINGTVMTLSALVESSSETLYRVHHGLNFLRGPDQHDSPSHPALLGNVSSALLSIGRTITGSSMPHVFPSAAAMGALGVTAEMINQAAGALQDAGKAIDGRGQQGHRPEFPGMATAAEANAFMGGDISGTVVALSELVASSSETLCRVQHGHSERGPGQPVTDLLGAADMLDKLSASLTYIGWTIDMSSMPDVSPPAAMPHLHRADHLIGQAATALEKLGKFARTKGQQPRRSLDFPVVVAPHVPGSGAATHRVPGLGQPAARRTL